MGFERSIKSTLTDASPPEGERHQLMLLIPAYNEEDRISSTLLAYWESLKQDFEGAFKIVVVINGCRDRTEDVVRSVANGRPEIAWMVFEEAIGKGGALIEGLRLAPEADLIGYVDADGATPPRASWNWFKFVSGQVWIVLLVQGGYQGRLSLKSNPIIGVS